MKNYILVHGAWGNAAEFDQLVKKLTSNDRSVTAIDLPGHGEHISPIADMTMQAYVQAVVDAISNIDGNVILVGHSLAGAIISQVAEVLPERIDKLVYIAAMLPKNGDTPIGLMQSDIAGELLPRILFSKDQSYATLKEDDVREVMLHDVRDELLIDEVMPGFYMKQATQPFMTPVELSDEKFGSIPKYYIRAQLDKVLSPSLQDSMLTNWDVEKTVTLQTGHFPLISAPDELALEILNTK
mgnify:CR=1 FL=1